MTTNIERILSERHDIAEAIQTGQVHLKRYNSDPPRFALTWPHVGGSEPLYLDFDSLWSWASVQKAMFMVWGEVALDMRPRDWHALLVILQANCEVVQEAGASVAAEVLDMLDNFCQRHSSSIWSASDLSTRALCRNGSYYFRMPVFESGALFNSNSRFYYQRYLLPRSKLFELLYGAGASHKVMSFKGKKIRVWEIPVTFNEPKEEAVGEFGEEEGGE